MSRPPQLVLRSLVRCSTRNFAPRHGSFYTHISLRSYNGQLRPSSTSVKGRQFLRRIDVEDEKNEEDGLHRRNDIYSGKPARRRLIICCDGTWQASNKGEAATHSNVAKLAQIISPVAVADDGTKIPQIVYYQAGIGTSTAGNSTWINRTFNWIRAVLQGIGGYGLSENVIEAYYFIVSNWTPDTELFLFGFSRGAYTARALAGIIAELGVFHKKSLHHFPEAYRNYRRLNEEEWKEYEDCASVEDAWERDEGVEIKVLGCWDTVGSLGIPEMGFTKLLKLNDPYKFHRVKLGHNVENAFHALALEERRRPYTPSLWHLPKEDETPARLIQCWFPGTHISVGGGCSHMPGTAHRHSNKCWDNYELADIAFQWMCSLCAPYLAFDSSASHWLKPRSYDALAHGSWARKWQARDSSIGLTYLAGCQTRLPGQYRLEPENKADKNYVAEDTGEYMHPSVRIRFGDKNPVVEWPDALRGFKLRQATRRDKAASDWEWVKVLEGEREVVIPEYRFHPAEATGPMEANLRKR